MLKFYAVTKGFPAEFIDIQFFLDCQQEDWASSIRHEGYVTSWEDCAKEVAEKVGGTVFHYRLIDLDYNFSTAVYNDRWSKLPATIEARKRQGVQTEGS